MKVKELMTKKVITVHPEENVDRVFFLFHFERIRHIPVLEKGKVVGIISDRDIKKILGPRKETLEKPDGTSISISTRRVRNIMRRRVVTIGPKDKASDAAAIMVKRKIGALPVIDKNGKLAGIITATDILKAFVKLVNDIDAAKKSNT